MVITTDLAEIRSPAFPQILEQQPSSLFILLCFDADKLMAEVRSMLAHLMLDLDIGCCKHQR